MVLTARARSGTLWVSLGLVLLLGLVGFLPLDAPTLYLFTLAMCWAIAAVGLDLFSGYLGQSSFGHAAFVAIGAYGATALRSQAHLSTVFSLIGALLLAATVALVIGLALVQLKHFGAALTTFFFALLTTVLLSGNLLDPIAHSQNGLPVPPLDVLASVIDPSLLLYFLTWGLLLIAVVITSNYANSRAGRALRLVKQNEVVAATMGIQVRATKLVAFVFSAMLAALAGFPISLAIGYLAPETFSPTESITLFAMAAVGGLGSIVGPIIGALFFTLAPQSLQVAGATKAIVFAVVLLASLIFLPEGLFGAIESVGRRLMTLYRMRLQKAKSIRPGVRTDHSPVSSTEPKGLTIRHGRLATEPVEMLAIREVGVRFGGITALQNVSLSVRAGETHALIGPNGAGKTTLVNCISGVQRTAHGTISFRGQQISGTSPPAIRRLGIARTFQHPSLVPDLSVIDNVKLGLHGSLRWSLAWDLAGPLATSSREARVTKLALRALRQVGFDDARDRAMAKDLSLADNRVVDIARAIASEADLLLLDEPTAGLSVQETESVARALQAVKANGLTVLLIAHDVKFVTSVADRITVLDMGAVLAEGLPDEVIANPLVIEAYLGVSIEAST
jgi:branched-chain amino acid transport system permease protein